MHVNALFFISYRIIALCWLSQYLYVYISPIFFFQVFAPTDQAFANLPAGTLASLSTAQLQAILQYHVVQGIVGSGNLRDGQIQTLQGSFVNVDVRNNGSIVLNGNSNVLSADNLASNGVVHIIDAVLIPP